MGVRATLPPIILGGNVFGWTADPQTSFRLLDRAIEAGLTTIDTADVYSRLEPGFAGGESETVIGDWLAASGKRDRVVIATKFGLEMGDGKAGLSRRYMAEAVEASLKRLRTDHIDLYFAHWDDETTPFEETLAGFDDLIRAGKIGNIGLCNFTPERLAAALDAGEREGQPRYAFLQARYNLLDREPFESAFAPLVEQYGLACWTYFSLASGFLTGKWRDRDAVADSKRAMWLAPNFTERGMRILDVLAAAAAECGATPAQVALAWLANKPAVTAPIASATSERQLDDLIAAASLKLDPQILNRLDDVSAMQPIDAGKA